MVTAAFCAGDGRWSCHTAGLAGAPGTPGRTELVALSAGLSVLEKSFTAAGLLFYFKGSSGKDLLIVRNTSSAKCEFSPNLL